MRRSPLVVLHVALAVALGALAGAYFAFSAWDSLLGTDAFFQLLGAGAPLLAGISCGLAADAEQRAGEGANVLGVSSRRGALAAKLAALLGWPDGCRYRSACSRGWRWRAVAGALRWRCAAGIALEACSYAILIVALASVARLHRDGALGFIAALTLMGGLANGWSPARSGALASGRPRSCRSRGPASARFSQPSCPAGRRPGRWPRAAWRNATVTACMHGLSGGRAGGG
ncbi:MAG: hypothetical protein ACLTEX_09560 [Eggerthella lenta]